MSDSFDPRRFFSYLFICAIAVLFALQWGPGSRGCDTPLTPQSTSAAATVNGKEIPLQDFQRSYASQLEAMRQQGSPLSESLAKQLGVPKQVLDQLVNTELLAQEAERKGIAPSDDEVREILRKNPDFQKDGRFDFERYREVLRDYYRRTDVDFESDLRRRLSANKLLDVVESAAVVSDDEVRARFYKEHDRAKATLVRFLPSMYEEKVPAPKPEDLVAFAATHSKEIADHYEKNRFRYHQQEQVRARHILLKVSPDATPEQKEEVKKKISALREQIAGGKDFAEAAKEFSEDLANKDKGGDLGFNERGAWVPAFADTAFSLPVGVLSEPVETKFGYHLIKVEEKKPPQKRELVEVEGEISKELYVKAKAKELAKVEAEKALAAVNAGKSLTELFPPSSETQTQAYRFALETKPESVDTGEFNAGNETLPRVGAAPEIVKDSMALGAPGPLGKVYESGEGYAVVVLTERSRPSEEKLTEQKDQLRGEAMKAKQFELRDAYLKALKASAAITVNEAAVGASTSEEG